MDIIPYGDQALLINFEQKIDLQINRQVMALYEKVKLADLAGISFLIPAYCSLVVGFEPAEISFKELKNSILGLDLLEHDLKVSMGRKLMIPVCYESSCGLDLAEVSNQTGLSEQQIVALHTNTSFHVFMIGFLPGFAYMGPLPEALHCSRKASPRTKVPTQSVGLAGQQTGIYPAAAPGGWQIIGQTPLPPFRGQENHPFLFQAGDQVNFQSISYHRFEAISNQVLSGTFNWGAVYGK